MAKRRQAKSGRERRKTERFTIAHQVVCEVGKRTYAINVRNVSRRGMLLDPIPNVSAGETVRIRLFAEGPDRHRGAVRGRVVGNDTGGMRISLGPLAARRMRDFLAEQVAPWLATRFEEDRRDQNRAALAAMHRELGNINEAHDLYKDEIESLAAFIADERRILHLCVLQIAHARERLHELEVHAGRRGPRDEVYRALSKADLLDAFQKEMEVISNEE